MAATQSPGAEIASPCIGVCALDDAHVCIGCGRSLDEIAAWSTAGDETKRAIVAVAAQRLAMIAKESS